MDNLQSYESFLNEKKPAGAPDFHHSDAPDANGRFRDLGIKDLAKWLIKTRKGDVKKISGSLTQQVVFNRNEDPKYAEKMEKVRKEVYKQLDRQDLIDNMDESLDEAKKFYKTKDIVKMAKIAGDIVLDAKDDIQNLSVSYGDRVPVKELEKVLNNYDLELEDVMESLVDEAFIGPFVFNDKMSDDELKAMYDGAIDGYAYYAKGMQYPKSDYKKAYQEIEKILKKRGVAVNEAKLSKIHKAAKKGSYPVSIVVINSGMVVKQELVNTPAAVPAVFNELQKKYPNATISVESKTGQILFSESLVIEAKPAGLSKKETLKVAQKFAAALTKLDGMKYTVSSDYEEDSFDLDIEDQDGVDPRITGEYAGGSYNINADGSVVNMAVWNKKNASPVYGNMDDDIKTIIKTIKNIKESVVAESNHVLGLDSFLVETKVYKEAILENAVRDLHFETDPKKAEDRKIAIGKSQGEVSKKKQIDGGNYSLKRFRKSINFGDGTYLGVFIPGSYDAVTSTLGDGPHKKAVKKVKWNQRKYNQWLEDVASNGGAENAFDMAQNAKNEPGLIDWVKKQFRGDDPMQRIQWDIEGFAESVDEAKNTIGLAFKEEQDYLDFKEFVAEQPKGVIRKNIGFDSKTKSWNVEMDVKVLDRIYGEGHPGNKKSGWYGGLPDDFESVIIESIELADVYDLIAHHRFNKDFKKLSSKDREWIENDAKERGFTESLTIESFKSLLGELNEAKPGPDGYMTGLDDEEQEDKEDAMKKQAEMDDDDPDAYKELPGDKEAQEKGKVKTSKHVKSYHELYGDKKDESMNEDLSMKIGKIVAITKYNPRKNRKELVDVKITDYIKKPGSKDFVEYELKGKKSKVSINVFKSIMESNINEEKAEGDRGPISDDAIETGLKNKSKETGVPIALLRLVMRRGLAAWKSGHRPGATQQQWGYARVNSFLTKQPGTWGGADKDIAKEVRDGGHDSKLKKA